VVKKNYDNMLTSFHPIPERNGRTDIIAISISRVSMLTRDKNGKNTPISIRTLQLAAPAIAGLIGSIPAGD